MVPRGSHAVFIASGMCSQAGAWEREKYGLIGITDAVSDVVQDWGADILWWRGSIDATWEVFAGSAEQLPVHDDTSILLVRLQ